MDNQQIGENIRNMRIAKDMTQDQLAQKLGYKSRSTINKIEMGVNSIHPTKILAFAKALDTTPACLLGLEEEDFNTYIIVNKKGHRKQFYVTGEQAEIILSMLKQFTKE